MRVLIVDDHQMFREGLRMLLSIQDNLSVIADVGNFGDAMRVISEFEVDLALLDICMPGRDGVEIIKHGKAIRPNMKVVVVSSFTEPAVVARVLRADVNGYVAKQNAAEEVFAAICGVSRGERYVCDTVARQLALGMMAATLGAPAHEKLSNREFKVMQMVVMGKPGRQIAEELCLSEKTISTHKINVLQKLGLKSTGELVRYAIDHHLP